MERKLNIKVLLPEEVIEKYDIDEDTGVLSYFEDGAIHILIEDEDEMLPSAIEIVVETGQASTSMLQRKLKLGYARAARLMDSMEEKGVIGPFEGSKPRQVLITKERWIEMKMISAARAEDNRRNY